MRLVGGRQGGETPGNHATSHKVQHHSCLDPNHCSDFAHITNQPNLITTTMLRLHNCPSLGVLPSMGGPGLSKEPLSAQHLPGSTKGWLFLHAGLCEEVKGLCK